MHNPLMDTRGSLRRAPRRGAADWSFRSIGAYPPGWSKARQAGLATARAALLAMLAVLAPACSRPPPEQALRDTIASLQAAAEARDAEALASHLAADFVGPGGMDRENFRRYAALIWLRNREVGITLGPLDIELTGEHARVAFTAATRGGEGFLPDSANLYQVDTSWRIEAGEWRLIAAEWEPGV